MTGSTPFSDGRRPGASTMRRARAAALLALALAASGSVVARTPVYASCLVRVKDGKGLPLPGTTLTFRDPKGKVARIVATTETGACVVSGLSAGLPYTVTATLCSYTPVELKVLIASGGEVPEYAATLVKVYAARLAEAVAASGGDGCIVGTVADAACRPVPSAEVVLDAVPPFTPRRTLTDEEGFYAFPGVAAGSRYQVLATAPGFSTVVHKPVQVVSGQATTLETFVRP